MVAAAQQQDDPATDDPLVEGLKDLRLQSTEIFLEILAVLDGVRTSATDMSAQMNAVADACRATSRVNEVSQIIDKKIQELQDVLEQTHRDIDGKTVKRELSGLMVQLPKILQNSGTFRYVGTLSQTTAATERMDHMATHVDLLKEIAERLKSGSERALAQIKIAVSAVDSVNSSISTAHRVVADLGSHMMAQTLQSPEGHNIRRAYKDTVSLTEKLVAGNRRDLGALIGLMQFSDAFAQRLEHVWAMLEDTETMQFGGAEIAKIQLGGMLQDASEVRAAVTDALTGFIASCDTALTDLSYGLSGETKVEIAAQMEKLQAAESLGGEISQTMVSSERKIAAASKSIVAVGDSLEEFSESVALMKGSSYNVAIKAAKHGDRQGPLAFLASIVADCSAETGQTIFRMSQTLNAQQEKLRETVFSDLKGTIEEFKVAMDRCEEIHAQVSAVDTHIETASDAARRLTADIDSALHILRRMTPIEENLRHILNQVSEIETQEIRDEICHNVYGTYTMDREREAHAVYFSIPQVEDEQSGALDDDDFEEF